jgi:hypothetical protein
VILRNKTFEGKKKASEAASCVCCSCDLVPKTNRSPIHATPADQHALTVDTTSWRARVPTCSSRVRYVAQRLVLSGLVLPVINSCSFPHDH